MIGAKTCEICTTTRCWFASVKPDAFVLLSRDGDLTTYASSVQHLFCKHCGVTPFDRGDAPKAGGPFVAINLGALNDVNPKRWAQAPVQYMDGRNDNYSQKPEFTAAL